MNGDPTGAVIDPTGAYRYLLWRRWEDGPLVMFIGLNPSTADASLDDPTIRRCRTFAQREGAGGLLMLNLFAFRATDPADMRAARHPIGAENDYYLSACAPLASRIIACWGAHGAYLARSAWVSTLLRGQDHALWCLARNRDGSPGHPLYLKSDALLQPLP